MVCRKSFDLKHDWVDAPNCWQTLLVCCRCGAYKRSGEPDRHSTSHSTSKVKCPGESV